MGYSIFEGTIADMTFMEVEEAAKNNSIVLFPIAVIEEHGPHICLGTDVYLAYYWCKKIKEELEKRNVNSIIVPPFYWGINHCTGSFTGSFSSNKEHMKNLLIEIMASLQKWGFQNIFPISSHLDFMHMQTILDAVKEAKHHYHIDTYMIFPEFALGYYGLTGNENYIIVQNSLLEENNSAQYLDVHAGETETGWMLAHYPDLVKKDIVKELPPSNTTIDDMNIWYHGGDEVKQMIPMGYIGDPSNINIEKAISLETSMLIDYVNTIYEFVIDVTPNK